MVPLLVFYLHTVAAAATFTRRYQEGGVREGFLAVFFFVLIFFVGWSISSFFTKLFLGPKGFGVYLDRDAVSLLLLTIAEGIFYYFFFSDDTKSRSGEER